MLLVPTVAKFSVLVLVDWRISAQHGKAEIKGLVNCAFNVVKICSYLYLPVLRKHA